MPNGKKILMLNWRCPSNPRSGGAEYVTRKHLEAWALAGYEVHWLAGGAKGLPRYEKLEVSDITTRQCASVMLSLPKHPEEKPVIHIHRHGTPITIYFLAPLIYWFKWGGKFDLVVDQIHGVPFLTPLWAWKSRKIAFIHEVAQEIWDEMLPFPINVLGKIYEKAYFFFYRGIRFWTVSDSTKRDLTKFGILKKQITIIPNAIDLEPVRKVPTKEKTLTLVLLGRLVKMKGVEDALRIVAEIIKTFPEVQLWVLGQGEPEFINLLKHLTTDLGISSSVDWKGWVSEDEKMSYLRRSHYLLHTSIREGFGLTVLEANSQGTPIIAYDTPGINELVEHGKNGFLLKRKTMLKDVIQNFEVNNPQYITYCRNSVTKASMFSWLHGVTQSLKLIEEV
jgi:glycosyltransferase involved in cell wall biosynthesis